MSDLIVNGGIVGILLIMALKLVFEFIDRQKVKAAGGDGLGDIAAKADHRRSCQHVEEMVTSFTASQATMAAQVEDLHDWHAPDSSGEQSWKNAQMIDVIKGVSDAVQSMAKVIDRLAPILEKLERKL